MRKNWPLIILLVLFAIIGLLIFNLNNTVSESFTTSTLKAKGNDTTIQPDGSIGEAVSCTRIPADYPFNALRAAGHTTEYERDVWTIDGEPVGYAQSEDSAFDACGPTELIDMMEGFK